MNEEKQDPTQEERVSDVPKDACEGGCGCGDERAEETSEKKEEAPSGCCCGAGSCGA